MSQQEYDDRVLTILIDKYKPHLASYKNINKTWDSVLSDYNGQLHKDIKQTRTLKNRYQKLKQACMSKRYRESPTDMLLMKMCQEEKTSMVLPTQNGDEDVEQEDEQQQEEQHVPLDPLMPQQGLAPPNVGYHGNARAIDQLMASMIQLTSRGLGPNGEYLGQYVNDVYRTIFEMNMNNERREMELHQKLMSVMTRLERLEQKLNEVGK